MNARTTSDTFNGNTFATPAREASMHCLYQRFQSLNAQLCSKLDIGLEEHTLEPSWLSFRPIDRPIDVAESCIADETNSASAISSENPSERVPRDRLAYLADVFGLTPFEQELVLLCAAVELEPLFQRRCAEYHQDATRTSPSFRFARDLMEGAHLSALAPESPLRSWRIIDVDLTEHLTSAYLRLDERILFFLCGADEIDQRLDAYLQCVPATGLLPEAYRQCARRLIECWTQTGPVPTIQLEGSARDDKRILTSAVAHALGLKLFRVDCVRLPASPADQQAFIRFCWRESKLQRMVLWVDASEFASNTAPMHICRELVEQVVCPTVLVGSKLVCTRPSLRIQVDRLDAPQQLALWEHSLCGGNDPTEGTQLSSLRESLRAPLLRIVGHFSLEAGQIEQIAQSCLSDPDVDTVQLLSARLWQECRHRASAPLNDLVQHNHSQARWDDLIVSEEAADTLREVAAHVRQSAMVHKQWGFASRSGRGLGVTALFVGPSGTGKTMAAEVLAGELDLDLFRIDLSQVISKFIGETEKNLSTIFDAAENAGAILLFDEADALFGKRSEVKDSHDRYANIEVSYLLQRMETYNGLALLTTNHRQALDNAFLRRIAFVINFGFPDPAQRERIWRNIWPPATPTADLDYGKLARLNVTGGSIRNIALNAAFLAADAGQPVRMSHLLQAARSECRKIDKG